MLKIGWATRDMTPTRPVMLQGQKHRRITREALDPLTVTALAIEGGQPVDCAIIVSCALPFITDGIMKPLRERLAKRIPAVPPDKIVLAATHTHTAFVTEEGMYDWPGGDVMTPAEGTELAVATVLEAAVAAWESRAPQAIGRAYGHAVVGHNRRALYADGSAEMYGKTNRPDFVSIEGFEDHSLDLLFTWNAAGQLTGVAISIPCPAQVVENYEQISADFWHDIGIELRKRFGASLEILGLCGGAGDISPHFLHYDALEAEMRKRQGLTECQEIARRVADAVSRALACTQPNTGDVAFAHITRHTQLTPFQVERRHRDWAAAEYAKVAATGDTTSWVPQRMRRTIDLFEGRRPYQPFPVEFHAIRLGDLVIVTNPFELFLDYALQIKARSAAAQTVIVQLTGIGIYLPTKRAVAGAGFSATPFVCNVGPEGGVELVAETLKMIGELFPG